MIDKALFFRQHCRNLRIQ